MKTIAIKGDVRTEMGKAATKQIRAAGMVPCVVYGKDQHVHFSTYQADFKNLVYTNNTYKVLLDVDGKKYNAILQDLQFHPVSEDILHADFLEVSEEIPVTVELPLKMEGTSPGVRGGGRIQMKYRKLKIKGLLKDIPEFVLANISSLDLGQSLRVRDVSVTNCELLDAPENAIISCKMTRAAISAAGDDELEGEEGAEEGAEAPAEGEAAAE